MNIFSAIASALGLGDEVTEHVYPDTQEGRCQMTADLATENEQMRSAGKELVKLEMWTEEE